MIRSISLARDESGRLAVEANDRHVGYTPLDVLSFIERYQPQQRPKCDLTIYLEDIGHQPVRMSVSLKTIAQLRAALRSRGVREVLVSTRALGGMDIRVGRSVIKNRLKGRDGREPIEGAQLIGDTILIEEI